MPLCRLELSNNFELFCLIGVGGRSEGRWTQNCPKLSLIKQQPMTLKIGTGKWESWA